MLIIRLGLHLLLFKLLIEVLRVFCTNVDDLANQNVIQQFVSRGFQIGDSEEESARQMWLAYYNFMYPPADPTPDYMATLEDVLTNTDRIFPEERKAFFLEQLVSGEIGTIFI